MFKRNKLEKLLLENIDKLNKSLQRNNFLDLVELLGDRKKLFIRNFSIFTNIYNIRNIFKFFPLKVSYIFQH